MRRLARFEEHCQSTLGIGDSRARFSTYFLRDSLHTSYLAQAFHLVRVEQFLELPLDSITAKQLRQVAGGVGLPRWPGVQHVTQPISARFQAVATREAESRGIARVHLDAVWWSVSRDADALTPKAP